MRFAYADPPYLGCGASKYGFPEWDNPERHRELIAQLCDTYTDGWAMSLHTPSLRVILPMCPEDCRVSAWVKPFASFKPNVNPAYAWEPVIWRGGRKNRGRDEATVRDWFSGNITLQKGLTGAKSREFCAWIIALLGAEPSDMLDDLYPGTGIMGTTFNSFCEQGSLSLPMSPAPRSPAEASR